MHSACKCPIFAKYFALVKTTSWMQVLRFGSKKLFIENLQESNFLSHKGLIAKVSQLSVVAESYWEVINQVN